ncbi:hypothetical protein F511_09933 [Dorcoceras hygrometricum]|uniref:Uncharacterized protein n=1 Tax=Dorcoceras hygrometricum TaxID=472368 RepID=A0A2Z7CNG3_9LAMI|nr:hypothetical protein F511_09933 [Dorcoceras hygrometricum]
MFLVDWAVKMRIRPPEFETSICDAKDHVSLMPPRRRSRGMGKFQESEGQNEDRHSSHSRTRSSLDEEDEVEGRGGQSRGRSPQFQQPSIGETQFRPFQQPGYPAGRGANPAGGAPDGG